MIGLYAEQKNKYLDVGGKYTMIWYYIQEIIEA